MPGARRVSGASRFWGRPVYLGATVLLPRDYDRSTISYPVNYQQGHFSIAPPLLAGPTGQGVGPDSATTIAGTKPG